MRRNSGNRESGALYVHYPCFDGIISGVLAWDFLEEQQNWTIDRICPVNYDVRDKWLTTNLHTPCAIVDFLYHPQALFWADHHLTSFVSAEARSDFEQRKMRFRLLYDESSGSCASLLWRCLAPLLKQRDRYKEMVDWAETIDSAAYSSVHEAILGEAPALQISFSLMMKNGRDYCDYLLRQLRRNTLKEVAQLPEVRSRYEHVRSMMTSGLDRLRNCITTVEDIVAFDVEAANDVIVSRYAPYYFVPDASYSIGLVRYPNGVRITAMRNPWRDFQSIPLGRIFERYGGGGHQRVASVFLSGEHSKDAERIADQLLLEIRSERSSSVPAPEGAVA